MIPFLMAIAIVLFLLAFWLFDRSRVIRKSGKIDCDLLALTDLKIQVEPTMARKIAADIVHLLQLLPRLGRSFFRAVRQAFRRFRRLFHRKKLLDPSMFDFAEPHGYHGHGLVARQRSGLYWASEQSFYVTGTMQLPTRAYVNDSCVVELAFLPEFGRLSRVLAKLSIEEKDGKAFIRAEWNAESVLIEVKLTGVGVDVTPIDAKIQNEESMFYSWGCSFPQSGIQTLVLRVSLGCADGPRSLRYVHRIKVVQVDHLTARHVRVLAGIAAALGAASTLIVVLKGLGILRG